MKFTNCCMAIFFAFFSLVLFADETISNNELLKELKVKEWLPTKTSSLNFTYSPICKSSNSNSQKKVRLLNDTKFLFGNLKAGDILFGVASLYQAKSYSIHAVAYCKPIFSSVGNQRNFESCLYDFNSDGFFDDRSDMAARFTKAPEEDFRSTKHQYPYEVVELQGEAETVTTCVTEDDKTWTADSKPNDYAKRIKSQIEIGSLLSRYELAKEKSVLSCNGESVCKKYFQLTQLFINKHSDMKIQVATDTIIETYNPTDLHDVGIKASKYPSKADSERIIIDVVCKGGMHDAECVEKAIAIHEKFRPFCDEFLN